MKITKLWKGFEADHSSTNYSFYSSTKALTIKDRAVVKRFSSRADATRHSVEFVYHGDFADLPNGAQEELLTHHFDIMIKESYDWWELILVLPYSPSLFKQLKEFDCEGEEELGITVKKEGNQIHLSIYCVLNYDAVFNLPFKAIELSDEKYWSPPINPTNPSPFSVLGTLLIRLKNEILNGNFTTLQGLGAFFDPDTFDKPTKPTNVCSWLTKALGHR